MAYVAIGIPHQDLMPCAVTASLIEIVWNEWTSGRCCTVAMRGHNLLSEAREAIVEDALRCGARQLLFLDSDIVAPGDVVARLLRHAKPIVSGLYYARSAPWQPVATLSKPERPSDPSAPRNAFPFLDRKTASQPGPLKVWCVGLGCCLIHCDVLRTLRKGGPLFDFCCREGEDIFFARRCEEVGIPIWLDRDLVVGHYGGRLVDEKTAAREAVAGWK